MYGYSYTIKAIVLVRDRKYSVVALYLNQTSPEHTAYDHTRSS